MIRGVEKGEEREKGRKKEECMERRLRRREVRTIEEVRKKDKEKEEADMWFELSPFTSSFIVRSCCYSLSSFYILLFLYSYSYCYQHHHEYHYLCTPFTQ